MVETKLLDALVWSAWRDLFLFPVISPAWFPKARQCEASGHCQLVKREIAPHLVPLVDVLFPAFLKTASVGVPERVRLHEATFLNSGIHDRAVRL